MLAERGLTASGSPKQIRTWNLSSLWRLPVEGQTVWLKTVPPFLAHEAPLIQALAGESVPRLLAHDAGRMLMEEVAGEDLYGASGDILFDMVDLLVSLQARWRGRIDDLLAPGLPDWRGPALTAAIAEVFARNADQLSKKDRGALGAFIDGLPGRFTELAACGLPDTLAHGDFHPGNLRGDASGFTLIDWGDSGVGHPLLDSSAFLDGIPAEDAEAVCSAWVGRWRAALPASDPARAMTLLAPPRRRGPPLGDLSGFPGPHRAG